MLEIPCLYKTIACDIKVNEMMIFLITEKSFLFTNYHYK